MHAGASWRLRWTNPCVFWIVVTFKFLSRWQIFCLELGVGWTQEPTGLLPTLSTLLLGHWPCVFWLPALQRLVYYHTHTPLSGTIRVSRYQKGTINLDFTEARDNGWQWHQLGHMQVCTSLQTDNHASTQPLSFIQAGCPSCCPTNSVKALKALSWKKRPFNGCVCCSA